MSAGWRLTLYGAGLVVAFGAAFGLANVIVPDDFVSNWAGQNDTSTTDH